MGEHDNKCKSDYKHDKKVPVDVTVLLAAAAAAAAGAQSKSNNVNQNGVANNSNGCQPHK